jgi:UDP-glucuronate decarboxylase
VKKVLVTGGAGFIGSHLCEKLLHLGNEVVCLDSLSSGSVKNIEEFLDHKAFHFVEQDVIDPMEFEVDSIYHLACPASPLQYQSDPIRVLKTTTIGTLNVLELAKVSAAKVLFASTSEIYGDPLEHPQKETYWGNVNTMGPRSCYDEGKRVAETMCFEYERQCAVDVRVVRLFNTYGTRMAESDGRVISNFITRALRGDEITIFGEGMQTRSFCFVRDILDGILLMMEEEERFLGPMNLGNPEEISIYQLAEVVKKLTNSESTIIHSTSVEDDPKRRRPDITLAIEKYNWKPKVSLEEGLKKVIYYFQSGKGKL